MRTHYQSLGLEPGAPDVEVKRAYRKLVRVHHPDVGGDKDAFTEIRIAFEVLSDQVKREQYDKALHARRRPRRPAASEPAANPGAGAASPVFRPGVRLRRGEDMTDDVRLTTVEVALGTTKLIKVEGRDLEVELPPGLLDGQTWTVKGGGAPGPGGPGDLHLKVRHGVATSGLDVLESVAVPWTTFVLGGEVRVRIPDGMLRTLWLPPRSTPGAVERVSHCGVKGTEGRGDLLVTFTLKAVEEVDETTALLLAELARRGL